MEHEGVESKASRITGTLLILLAGLVVAMSSILKFTGLPGVVHQMAAAGFSDGKLTLVATLEISSALLFLYPRTRSFGLLLLSSFLGGAICTHVQMGEYAKGIGPSVLLTLAWVGTWLRHPQALWSLSLHRAATSSLVSKDRDGSWASKSV